MTTAEETVKRTIAALAAFSALFVFIGCAFANGEGEYATTWVRGSGIVTTENRTVASFTGIDVEGSGDVELSQGLVQSVSVQCDDNLQPYVKTDVIGQVIHLGFRSGTSIHGMTRLHFRIVVPQVDAVVISGSGSVQVASGLKAESLSLSIHGSGSIDAQIEVAHLVTSIGGSGDIVVSGSAGDLAATINGSGNMRARALQSAQADIRVNGSGSASVSARDTIRITISGSGDVEYGGGARATISATGSGTARQR